MSAQLDTQTPGTGERVAAKKWLSPFLIVATVFLALAIAYFSGLTCKLGFPKPLTICPIICPPGTTCVFVGGGWKCV